MRYPYLVDMSLAPWELLGVFQFEGGLASRLGEVAQDAGLRFR